MTSLAVSPCVITVAGDAAARRGDGARDPGERVVIAVDRNGGRLARRVGDGEAARAEALVAVDAA
jgi:hypothetical protein